MCVGVTVRLFNHVVSHLLRCALYPNGGDANVRVLASLNRWRHKTLALYRCLRHHMESVVWGATEVNTYTPDTDIHCKLLVTYCRVIQLAG